MGILYPSLPVFQISASGQMVKRQDYILLTVSPQVIWLPVLVGLTTTVRCGIWGCGILNTAGKCKPIKTKGFSELTLVTLESRLILF